MDHAGNIEEALAPVLGAGAVVAAGAAETAACQGSEAIKGSGCVGKGGWVTPAEAEVANQVVAAKGGSAMADDAAVVPLRGPANPAQGGRELLELPGC